MVLALTVHVHEFPCITRSFFWLLMALCHLLRTKTNLYILTVLFEKHKEQYPQVPSGGDIIVTISSSIFFVVINAMSLVQDLFCNSLLP